MAIIAKYKFNPSLYADYLPTFNSEFTGYTKSDVNNSDGTITRTISHDTLKPTLIRFGTTESPTDREKSLLEVMECDTSSVINMYSMFNSCTSLTILNASSFNTSNVTNMGAMFKNCNKLTSLDLSNFDTSNVTNMNNMFTNCSSLTSLNLSSFDTSQVNAMNSIFDSCPSLTSLDLSKFNTGKVTNMSNMFLRCSSLTSLDLSNFDTSNVNNMGGMFNKCPVSNIGLLYTTSTTINGLLTELGTSTARNIYYTDAPLDELTVQDNITYIKYELTKATFPYTLNKLPNGVVDYIDVVNKVHVQRVRKVILNGNESWSIVSTTFSDGLVFQIALSPKAISDNSIMCDKLEVKKIWGDNTGQGIAINSTLTHLQIKHTTIKTVDEFKTWLASNPITVIYGIETPIYTPLTDEEIAQLPLSAYKDGYINLSSDQLTPSFEFRMRASNRYQVDMLETGYYYLNAPVGNVKLGTANVDVQQMPCIVKVDNVGTGDSGYRLGLVGLVNNIQLFDRDFNSTFGKWLELSNGELMGVNNPEDAYTDYIEVSPTSRITVTSSSDASGLYKINVVQYDKDKTFISGVTSPGESLTISVNLNVRTKYIRVSYRVPESSYNSGINTINIKQSFPSITLAKLPSHRIPTSFTQGMKCATDFGYWEGIKVAKPYLFRTMNISTGWSSVETIEVNIGELNRIESGNTIVEDEFDISTGKFTKRIGKVVLDGSNDCLKESFTADNQVFQRYIIRVDAPHKNDCLGLTNYLPFLPSKDKYGVDYVRARETNDFWLYQKEDLSTEEVRKRLAGNPITVYYELAVPEISYINLSSNQVKTVANTGLQCICNGGYLNAQCKPSHLTYPVPSLVGNRTYTVVHNRKNITGSTKPIELNLGGTVVQLNDASSKTLVKTPSTLAHSNLIFIGGESTVDHIMVLGGDWTNKPIEYFENMKGHDTDAIITIMGDGKIDDVAEQYLW